MTPQEVSALLEAHAAGWSWPDCTCLSMVGKAVDHRFAFVGYKTEERAYKAGAKVHETVADYYRAELAKAGCVQRDEPRVGDVFIVLPPVECENGTVDRGQAMCGIVGHDGRPWLVTEDGLTVAHGFMEYWGKDDE